MHSPQTFVTLPTFDILITFPIFCSTLITFPIFCCTFITFPPFWYLLGPCLLAWRHNVNWGPSWGALSGLWHIATWGRNRSRRSEAQCHLRPGSSATQVTMPPEVLIGMEDILEVGTMTPEAAPRWKRPAAEKWRQRPDLCILLLLFILSWPCYRQCALSQKMTLPYSWPACMLI